MNNKRQRASCTVSVEERFNTALLLLREQKGEHAISISAVCKAAGVSRANIYSNHPDLVAKVPPRAAFSKSTGKLKETGNASCRELQLELQSVKKQYHALLATCIELEAELSLLRRLTGR